MKKLDQQIKTSLSTPQAPPIDAWEAIEARLNEKDKKRFVIGWWLTPTAASIALIFGVFFFYPSKNQKSVKNNPIVKQINKLKNQHLEKENNNNLTIDEQLIKQYNNKDVFQNNTHQPYRNLANLPLNEKFPESISMSSSLNLATKNDEPQKIQILEIVKQTTDSDTTDLEDLLEKKEETKKIELVKNKATKIAISTYYSPTMMLNKRSILSEEFAENPIQNQVSTVYGANISYQFAKNWKVNAGIAKVNLDQTTKHVTVSTPVFSISNEYASVGSTKKRSNHHIQYSAPLEVSTKNDGLIAVNQTAASGQMNQRVEFIEIPLEIEYQLLDHKKFKVAAVGGSSYYMLTKNSISIENPTLGSRTLGSATNLNESHFSANGGIKLGYELNKNINLNIQPTFKVFFNQFNQSDSKTPALLGVNFGASIKIK